MKIPKVKTKKLDKAISRISFALMRILWLKPSPDLLDHEIIFTRAFQLVMTAPAFVIDLVIVTILYLVVKLGFMLGIYGFLFFAWIFSKAFLKVLAWIVPTILIALAIFIYQEGKWSDIVGLFAKFWSYFFGV